MKKSRACISTLLAFTVSGAASGIEHGSLDIVQLNNTNNNQAHESPAVSITVKPGNTPDFVVRGHNKGDTDMAFSSNASQDPFNGVMLSSVTQNGRNNFSGGGKNGISYATSHAEIAATGFYVPVHATSGSIETGGTEYNMNLAAAWFPYADGWLGGHTRNATANGPVTSIYAAPSIRLASEFIDEPAAGISTVNLTARRSHGVPATSSNGVLLVTGGRNAATFAMARDNADGTFTVSAMANTAATTQAYTQDSVAFAYIPTVAAGKGKVKALGRIQSDGSTEVGGGSFTVTKQGTGQWLLTVAGQSDTTGTLIVSPEGGLPPADASPVPNNTNNIISYQWESSLSGWLIQSRNLPGAALEDGATVDEDMFSFAFLTQNPSTSEPSVSLSFPLDGHGSATLGVPMTLTADATVASPATIQQVEFFVNGVSVGVDTTAPYSSPFTPPSLGIYLVEAFATSSDNGIAGSKRVRFLAESATTRPTLPGYSAGLLNGGDQEAELFPTSPTPAWTSEASTPAPKAFDTFGNTPGKPAVMINGAPVPFASGILLGSNFAGNNYSNAANRGPIDNNVVTNLSGGNYELTVLDNQKGLSTGKPATQVESSRFSLGFFPYANGWMGANIAADLSVMGGSSNLPAEVAITSPSTGNYQISGLPLGGNMLAISTGSTADNFLSIGQTEDRWVLRNTDNSQNVENDPFGFLYVPRSSTQVLSGKVADNGTLTSLNLGLDSMGATVTKLVDGYEILFGDGTLINPTTAALFINADFNNGNGADNAYVYYAQGNKFVVFSHDLPGLGGNFQSGGFRFMAAPFNPQTLAGNEVAVVPVDDIGEERSTDSTIRFKLIRSDDLSSPLTVNYQMSGSATQGADYGTLPGTVNFAAGQATATVTVNVLDDIELEVEETVTLTVLPGTGYAPGISASRWGTILNSASLINTTMVSFQEGTDGYTGQYSKVVTRVTPRTLNAQTQQYEYGTPVDTSTLGRAVAADYVDGYPYHQGSDPTGDSPDENGIVRFDNIFGTGPGQIPQGAVIVKAELQITTNTGANSPSGGIFTVDRLLVPVDDTTTYATLDQGAGFEGVRGQSGMSIGEVPVAGFSYLESGVTSSADVTSLVRHWSADPSVNYGFSIFVSGTSTTDGWEYCTEGNPDAAKRPKLVVSYAMPASSNTYTYELDRSAQLKANVATTDGAGLGLASIVQVADATEEMLVHFPVPFGSIPADEEIVKAELLISTSGPQFIGGVANAHSRGPVAVHRMLNDWNTSSQFGVRGPDIGVDIAPARRDRAYSMGQGSQASFDVTDIVQAWRAGTPNHGLNLKPEVGDNWQIFGALADPNLRPQLRIVTATTGPVTLSPFEQWAQSQGVNGVTMTSDKDKDGIVDLVEYALGLNPNAPGTLPKVTIEGGNSSIRFTKGAAAAADSRMSYKIQTSSDLANWSDASPVLNNTTEISMTAPAGTAPMFYRLTVTYAAP